MACFVCPITFEIMREPLVDIEGNTYEGQAIRQWLHEHGTSPITRALLSAPVRLPPTPILICTLSLTRAHSRESPRPIGTPMTADNLAPNRALRETIETLGMAQRKAAEKLARSQRERPSGVSSRITTLAAQMYARPSLHDTQHTTHDTKHDTTPRHDRRHYTTKDVTQ